MKNLLSSTLGGAANPVMTPTAAGAQNGTSQVPVALPDVNSLLQHKVQQIVQEEEKEAMNEKEKAEDKDNKDKKKQEEEDEYKTEYVGVDLIDENEVLITNVYMATDLSEIQFVSNNAEKERFRFKI